MVDQGGAEKKNQMGRNKLSEEFCWGKNWGWEKEGREWRMKERQTERERKRKQKFCWHLTPSEEHQERETGSGQNLLKRGSLCMHTEP